MTNNFIPISTTPKDTAKVEEVVLEDITAEEDEQTGTEVVLNPESKEEQQTVEEEVTKEEKPSDVVEKKKPAPEDKHKSRAKKRIKQLSTEKGKLQSQLDAIEVENVTLRQRLLDETRESKGSMRKALENSLGSITDRLKKAIEEGNSEKTVKIQDEMMNVKMQLAGVSSDLQQIENVEIPEAKPEQTEQQEQQEVPEQALEWIDNFPQFKTDELFYVSALTVNSQLIKEGFDPAQDDFYEELNSRLSPRFPEIFGGQGENSVEYNKESNKTDSNPSKEDSEKDEKEESSSEQIVSGPSRSPAGLKGKNKRGSKDTVTLSPEMVKNATRWGLSLETMAKRVSHNEKNRKTDGYVPILMGK